VNFLYHASLFSLFSIVIAAAPMVSGLAFALRPAATRLALVRALTLVGVFVTVANLLAGAINVLIGLAQQPPMTPEPPAQFYTVLAEHLVVPFIGCVFLALAWAGVAIGLRKPFDH
jgi:hypothetical protein